MTDTTTELKPALETPGPQAAAEEVAPPETGATEPAEEQPPEVTPRYLIDGEPVEDEYAILDHPKLKPHIERHEQRVEETLRGQYEERLTQATQKWESTNLHNALSTEMGRVMDRLSDSDLERTDKVLTRLERMVEPYLEPYRQSLRTEGAEGLNRVFYDALLGPLDRKSRDEFEDTAKTKRGLTWPDAIEEWSKLRFGVKEADYKRQLQAKDDVIERMKAEGRTGQGPNLAPSGSGGGKQYSQMTAEERSKMSPQERDAAVARELQGA